MKSYLTDDTLLRHSRQMDFGVVRVQLVRIDCFKHKVKFEENI